MRKIPNPQKDVDMKKLMALTIPQRQKALGYLNSPASGDSGISFLEALTPSQYAALFPDYYKRRLPDTGLSTATSGGTKLSGGGDTKTGRSYATGGAPSAGRADTTPATSGKSGDEILSSTKGGRVSSNIWKDGTTVVNKGGKLLDRIEGGNLVPDGKGYVDPKAYYKEALQKLTGSKLIGFVPEDGEKFGIKKGTKEEWARFMTQLTKQESSFNVETIGDKGNSIGLSQMKAGEYGITDPHDPHQAQSGMIKQFEKYIIPSKSIAGQGSGPGTYGGYKGAAAYFGPLRRGREDEFFKHTPWMEKLRPTLDAVGEELPSLGMFTKEALAQKEKTAVQTSKNETGKGPIFIGDSVAAGLHLKHYGRAPDPSIAVKSLSPSKIFDNVQKMNPESLKGQNIVLSSGLLNNTKDAESVKKTVEYLKAQGANVTLIGGPVGAGTSETHKEVNSILEGIAKEQGVKFSGGFAPAGDGYHPGNDKALLSAVVPSTTTATPLTGHLIPEVGVPSWNRISGDPHAYSTNTVSIQTPYGPARVSKDAAEAYSGFFNDLKSVGAPISKLGSYNIRGKNSAGAGHNPGSGWSQHSYGNAIDLEDSNVLSKNFIQWQKDNPGKFEELKKKWGMLSPKGDEPHMEFGGKISQSAYDEIQKKLAENNGKSGVKISEQKQEEKSSTAVPISQRGITAGMVSAKKDETNIANQMWTSLERAPTKEEIKDAMSKGVKHFDFDLSKKGGKEAQDIINKSGGNVIAYHRGPGNAAWNESSQSKEDVLKQIKGMDAKYIHLDNQDKWKYDDFKDVINQSKEAGKIIQPKGAMENWVKYLKENPEYAKQLLYATTENQVENSDIESLKSLQKQVPTVNMEWQKETSKAQAESLLKNTGIPTIRMKGKEVPDETGGGYHSPGADVVAPEKQKEPDTPVKEESIPENKYGGTHMSPGGEPIGLTNLRTGKSIATMGNDESIKFEDGHMKISPNRRVNPEEIALRMKTTNDFREESADKENEDNALVQRAAVNSQSQPSNYGAMWQETMASITNSSRDIFQTESFRRSTGKSRFVEVGDPISGGHYQEGATDMSLA